MMATFSNIKGDLSGALTAATITLPPCIGYGIIVFAPLGVDFAASGALLGLYTAVFAGFLAAWLGGNPIQISGPKAPSTLVLAAVVAALAVNPQIPGPLVPRVAVIIGLVSITILIGKISTKWPEPVVYLDLLRTWNLGQVWNFLPYLIIPGLVLGLLGSLESLLTCVAADTLSGNRHHSNRELIGQGLGNIVSSCFGAIFAAGSVPRTLANYRAGGRTSLSGMMCSVFILLIIVALGPLVGKIPLAVIASIIIAVAITMVDMGSINIVKKLAAEVRQHRRISFKFERGNGDHPGVYHPGTPIPATPAGLAINSPR
ncbi:MAG: SulP family inorganic anion transporter [Thermodesulfobacteriota bacterium]